MAKKNKPKKYEIRTIEDISKMITIGNADNFLKDFRSVIAQWLLIKEIERRKKIPNKIKFTSFKWIDDKEHKIFFTFNPLKNKKKK